MRFFEFVETSRVKQFAHSHGLERHDLPQIHAADIPDFLEFLKENGVHIKEKTVPVSTLKPTQKEYLEDKVEAKIADFDSGKEKLKPFLVSSDNFIMDSHHQLVALKRVDKSQRVEIMQADVDVDKMLALAKEYPKAMFKKVHEAKIEVEDDEDEDRTKISIPSVGYIVLTETSPKYEFVDDLTEKEFDQMNLDENDRIGKLEHIEVILSKRGHGYARQLMEEALKLAKKKEFDILYLNACPMGSGGLDLHNLTAFYEKFGFRVFKRQGGNNLMIKTA